MKTKAQTLREGDYLEVTKPFGCARGTIHTLRGESPEVWYDSAAERSKRTPLRLQEEDLVAVSGKLYRIYVGTAHTGNPIELRACETCLERVKAVA